MKRTGMKRRTRGLRAVGFTPTVYTGEGETAPRPARKPIKPVSVKRARENRERAAMADRLYPDRRDGTVMCAVPWCPHLADDLHEPLTRARGGSITDEDNAEPLCRKHHDQVTFQPESQLQWAYDLGILVHSWDHDSGGGVA